MAKQKPSRYFIVTAFYGLAAISSLTIKKKLNRSVAEMRSKFKSFYYTAMDNE